MNDLIGRPFLKMNGLGNDFVIIDLRQGDILITNDLAKAIADRETGVGCDQVITIEDHGDDLYMGIWNADGEPVGACGNATRCVASIVMTERGVDKITFATPSGPVSAVRVRDAIAVDMGAPRLNWEDIPLAEQVDDTRFVDIKLGPIDAPVLWGPSAVNMGNPHCVFFVDDVDAHALDRFGPMVENHPMFPERANVSIAQVRSAHDIRLRVWERGAGVTKACGTAACAALVAANRRRLSGRKATIELDGGSLAIEWRDSDDHVIMTGPVTFEFDGVFSADMFPG